MRWKMASCVSFACALLVSTCGSADTAVRIEDYGPCAQISLYVTARRAGASISWEDVVDQLGPGDGDRLHSLSDIETAAKRLGLHVVVIEAAPAEWKFLPTPLIAHMKYPLHGKKEPHFVTILDVSSPEGVWLIDPPNAAMKVMWPSFEAASTNRFLYLTTSEVEAQQLSSLAVQNSLNRLLLWLLVANSFLSTFALVCFLRSKR